MAGTYEFLHPLPLCQGIPETIEDWREIADRNRPYVCPKCNRECPRIPSVPNFNMIFPGSTRADFLAQKLTQESVIAQEEGFRSKGEIEEALGQAEDRAAAMGQKGKQLIGPVQSPFKEVEGKKTFDPVSKPKDHEKQIKTAQEARKGLGC